VSLGFTPNDSFDGTLIYKTQKTELGIQSYDSPELIGLLNSLLATNYRTGKTQAVFDSAFGSKDTTDEAILNLNLKTGIGTLTSVTGYGKVDQHNAQTLQAESTAWSEEVRLASDSSGPLNWIVGAYYRTVDRDVDAFSLNFSRDSIDQWAVFGQTYWTFAPKWTATFGLRYGQYEIELTDKFNGLPTVSDSFNNLSPKLALDWQIDEDTLAYASVAQGFRAGGANVDQSFGTDPRYNQGFDDDTIWNYELGLKVGLWENRLTINTALFYIDWTDIQIDKAITSVINPPVQFIVTNGKDAHSYGIETDVYVYPADGWTVTLGGSWLQAEYDGGTIDTDSALNVSIDGDTLPNAPEYLFNASVEKRFAVGGSGMEGFVRTDYTIRGSSYADVPNNAPPGGTFESGRFELLNIRAGIERDFWALQLFATNVFNQDASSFNFSNPASFADVHVLLQPRTIGINLKMNYN
jgi:iron complex outermembrane recepter protein